MTASSRSTMVFVGKNLLGDCLCTTPSIRAFRRDHPEVRILYVTHDAPHCRVLEANPDIDAVVYSDALVDAAGTMEDAEWIARLPIAISPPCRVCHLDVFAVHAFGEEVFRSHLSHGFARLVDVSIASVRPVVVIRDEHRAAARAIAGAQPYVVLGMHSTSPVVGPGWASVTKDWVLTRWLQLARHLRERSGLQTIAVGAAQDQAVPSRHWRNLYGLPIKVVGALMAGAAYTVTVESGLAHLAHAVDASMVVIYSKDVPLEWASPTEATNSRVLYDTPRLITTDHVLAAIATLPQMRSRQEAT